MDDDIKKLKEIYNEDLMYIPRSLMYDSTLHAGARGLYITLIAYMDEATCTIEITNEEIASLSPNDSYKRTMRYLNMLIFHGYIKKVSQDKYLLVANLN